MRRATAILALALLQFGCDGDPESPPAEMIVGTWQEQSVIREGVSYPSAYPFYIEFSEGGTFRWWSIRDGQEHGNSGTYSTAGDTLYTTENGATTAWSVTIDGDTLTMTSVGGGAGHVFRRL